MAERALTNHELLELDINHRWEDKRPHGLKNRRKGKKRDRRNAINGYVDPRFDRRCYKRRASDK
jgi:hypothetical protein